MLCFVEVVLGAKYDIRIGDLADEHAIRTKCFACSHTAIMSAGFFKKRFPSHTRIIHIEHKFHCTKCGNRTENYWQIMRQIQQDDPDYSNARAPIERRRAGE